MKLRGLVTLGIGLISSLGFGSAMHAADVPIPVRVYINKPGSKTKFVSKGVFALPDSNTANPASLGATITFGEGGTTDTISLPVSNWTALGNPPGAKGFKYKDTTGASCRTVLIKGTTIKGLCTATAAGAPSYDAGSDPPVSIVLSIGPATQRYCAECPNGGVQKGNPSTLTKLKDCLAPASCPAGPPAATPTDTATPLDTPTPTHTHTETPTPTATEISGPACCEFGGVCGGEDADFCRTIFGTPVAGGTVCDASGECVATPAVSGDCCEFSAPVSYCTMPFDQPNCVFYGGVYHANADACAPSGECTSCGDNVREGIEGCDGTDDAACPGSCDVNCRCIKRVFVTSTFYDGNLGGLSGADAKCAARAAAAGFAGIFKAWLSDTTASAAARLTHSSIPYVRPDGTKVADDWNDLTDGTLDAPIIIDELGFQHSFPVSVFVWTATDETGAFDSADGSCADWTSNSGSVTAGTGVTITTNGEWTNYTPLQCSESASLYCFQQ